MIRSMPAVLLGALLALPARAEQRPDMTSSERDVLAGVHNAIEHRDCALAIARLNKGLAEKFPDVYLMAGSMYEQGLCLKASWERAERMYQLAQQSGHKAGMLRLIAGYAHQRRDPAAALWWTRRHAAWALPPDCRVDAVDDPDAFVAALRRWPAGRLDACTYVAGVMAALAGEVQYPSLGLDFAMGAKVHMVFVPAAAALEWKTTDIEQVAMHGLVDGDVMRDRNARSVQSAFQKHLEQLGASVLRRYERPDGVDPAWRVEQRYVFSYRYRYY